MPERPFVLAFQQYLADPGRSVGTVNPVSAYGWKFDKDEFRARLQEAVDVPVINVKEELT